MFAGVYSACAVPVILNDGEPRGGFILGSCFLGSMLVMLSAADVKAHRLPDILTKPLIAAGVLFSFYFHWQDVVESMIAATLGYLSLFTVAWAYEQLRGREGLGLGDAKLFAAAGAWLGLSALPGVLLIASGAALFAMLVAAAFGKTVTPLTRLAFGPFLAFGSWVVWLEGPVPIGTLG
jgi:leader peptidase (prepilin peptidase)/N-methyltransferase